MSGDRDRLKRAAALYALEEIEEGMVVGLGTGSTARFLIEGLGARVAQGLKIRAIPTSKATALLARRCGIPLAGFEEERRIDLTIDGADEVERRSLDLIKGRGGALLREKIVAAASARLVIVVDDGKLVDRLGERTPVPVEVAEFGWQATALALERLGSVARLRRCDGGDPYVTDGGNLILDCDFGAIKDPAALEREIALTVGAFESGLFVGRASAVVSASEEGIEVLERDPRRRR